MKKLSVIIWGLALVGMGLAYFTLELPRQNSPHSDSSNTFLVKNVVDGDTIEISRYGQNEKVRLIGVDTPETVDPRKTVQCFGKEASDYSKGLMTDKIIRLEFDPTVGERDKYHRLLAYVWLDDKSMVNNMLISGGFAHEYTYRSQTYKYQSAFKELERQAKTSKTGLWSETTCNGITK